MKERTEEDIIAKAPVEVSLGTEKYPIKPLGPIKARGWRTKLNEAMSSIITDMPDQGAKGDIGKAMTAALVAFPDKVSELLFQYAPELPKTKIEEEASEEQIALAFGVVMKFAYPFLVPLVLATQVTKSQLR